MDYIIIVAGGKGLRMGSDIPKQFLPIGGKPVLMRTLERFREYSKDIQIILVLPESQQEYWHQLCDEYHFDVEYTLANGGQTRFHSVQNGLAKVPDDAQPGTVYKLGFYYKDSDMFRNAENDLPFEKYAFEHFQNGSITIR